MVTNKKIVMPILIFCLLSVGVLAQSFEVIVTPINSKIFSNETAFFRLGIQNKGNTIEQFYIFSSDVEWGLVTQPTRDYVLKVYPNSYGETLLGVTPYVFTRPGLYAITVSVKALSREEFVAKKVIVEIKSEQPQQYLPSVHVEGTIAETVDPRNPVKVRADLVNQNQLEIAELELTVSSGLFSKSYTTSLAPLESKSLDFTVNFDPFQAPVTDSLKVTAVTGVGGKTYTYHSVARPFQVMSYGKLVQTETTYNRWLKRITVITLYNDGNAEKEYAVRIKRNIFTALLNSFEPEPRVVEFYGADYYSWPVLLRAREKTYVTIVLNLWPPVILALAVFLAILLYYTFRSPLLLIKSSQILSTKNGGIELLSIQLDIKNRGKRTLRNVHIIDKLPNLLDHHKEAKAGVVAPDNVLKHEKKGTILKWGLGSLEPFEERVITYKAVARLNIIGGLSLPAAYGNFEKQTGVERSTHSNVLYLKM